MPFIVSIRNLSLPMTDKWWYFQMSAHTLVFSQSASAMIPGGRFAINSLTALEMLFMLLIFSRNFKKYLFHIFLTFLSKR